MIDKDEDKLARVSSNMDVFCLQGNGTSYATQIEAGIKAIGDMLKEKLGE